MSESDSYNISDRLRSRSDRHGGTGDSNMGNTASKAEARLSPASNMANDGTWTQPLYKYLVCVSSGFVFGFAMEKGRGNLGVDTDSVSVSVGLHFLFLFLPVTASLNV